MTLLSTFSTVLDNVFVIPVIAGALLSVIATDYARANKIVFFSKHHNNNNFRLFLDVILTYSVAIFLASIVLTGVIFFFVIIGHIVNLLFP
jgi:hypothetical protein